MFPWVRTGYFLKRVYGVELMWRFRVRRKILICLTCSNGPREMHLKRNLNWCRTKPQITKFIELRILRLKLIIYPKMKLFYKVNNIPCVISLWRLFLPSTFSEFNSITLYVYNIVVLLTSRWVRSIKYIIILGQNVDIILICI